MALTRKEKVHLLEAYKKNLESSKNVIAMRQQSIPVNEINTVRSQMAEVNGKMLVVKKRIFLNVLKEAGYEWWELKDLDGSVVVVYSYDDEFAPLKAVSTVKKGWKKSKSKFDIEYLWGWFWNEWKWAEYVTQLAEMPSKEELVGKFMYMINYPIQSFAQVLDQIRQKKESWNDVA